MRSQRQLKVGEEIRHALAALFQRGDVPWPAGFKSPLVTVTEVQVSPDLRNASAFITTIGDEKAEDTRRVLNGMVGFFRHALADAVRMRFVPKLDFKTDTSFDYATNIERILHKPEVARDLSKQETEPLSSDETEDMDV